MKLLTSYLSFLLIFLYSFSQLNAQWNQLGADIDGEAIGDNSGASVSLNGIGDRMAIGANNNDGNGSNSGHVRVYEWNGTAWVQLGADIDGEAANDQSGISVSMNDSGNRIAIGANGNSGNGFAAGHVRIYEWNGSAWIQLGADIDGEAAIDLSGLSVSMNGLGDRLAIGAVLNDGSATDAGHVRVYEWNGSAWIQLGTDLDGEAGIDQFGYSVSMNLSGDRLAIGANQNDGNGNNSGHVRVYEWNGSAWIQLGADIDGEAAADQSGYSVSMNSLGDKLAIGAIQNDGSGNGAGHVRVYEWNGTAWVQLGADIDGEAAADQSGYSVSMNSLGDRLAIGAIENDGNGSNSGHARVYEWNGSAWIKLGADIDGEAANNRFGRSISMNSAGDLFAVGADFNNSNTGHVRAFEFVVPVYPEEPGAGYNLAFDGINEYVDITNPGLPTGNSPRTVEAWIKPGTNILQSFVDWGSLSQTVNQRFGLLYYSASGLIGIIGEANDIIGNIAINDGEWHHISASFDGSQVSLYIDGVLDVTAFKTYNTQNAIGTIGRRSWGGEQFDGEIDEVRIWNTGLNQATLQQYMNQKVNANHPDFGNLVAYYRFDEGSGTDLFDLQGSADGSLVNMGDINWQLSGASLGDTSVLSAPVSNVNLSMDNGLSIIVKDFENPGDYVSIYKVEDTAYTSTIPPHIIAVDDRSYFGVKMNNGGSYNVEIDYSANPTFAAAANERNIRVLKRDNGADGTWEQVTSRIFVDIPNNLITVPGQSGTEYVVGFTNVTYPDRPGSGYALEFDGIDEYLRTTGSSFTVNDNFTLEGWAQYRTSVGFGFFVALRSTLNPGSGGIALGANGNQLTYTINNGINNVIAGPTLTDGQWYHIALVRRAGTYEYYVNGIQQTISQGGVPNNPYSEITIGGRFGLEYWTGAIDEVRIWEAPLSQTDIRKWMCQKLTPAHDSINKLKAYYRFDENQGDTLFDLAMGNNAEFVNMETTDWTLSGAHLGDTSTYSYPATIQSLVVPNGDDIRIAPISAANGHHIYYVNEEPIDNSFGPGLDSLLGGKYYGVFVTEPTSTYQSIYSYNSVTPINDAEINLAERDNNSWNFVQSNLSTRQFTRGFNSVRNSNVTGPREFMLALGTNNALDFDGVDDYIAAPSSPLLDIDSVFTISFWFKSNDINQAPANILQRGPNYSILFESINDQIQLGTGIVNGANPIFISGLTIPDTDWHFYAYAYDGTTFRGYRDSVELINTTVDFYLTPSIDSLRIGRNVLLTDFGNMQLDELRIWQRSLCDSEIFQYRDCENQNTNQLSLYYKFNQGIAEGNNNPINIIEDNSPNGLDATMFGFTKTASNSNFVEGPDAVFDTCANITVSPLITSITQNSAVNCFGDSTTLTVNVSGGSGLYTFNWSSGDITQTTTNLGPGNYTVTVSDGSCALPDTLSLTINNVIRKSIPADTLNSVVQLGTSISATNNFNDAGESVSINETGNRMAVSAPGLGNGLVNVLEWDGASWSFIGSSLTGEAAGDRAGMQIDVNDAGDIIAIGAHLNDGNGANSGHVRVYEWNGTVWSQMGADIDGEAAGDLSGLALELNSLGNRIVIGAEGNDGFASNAGHARVFEWDGSNWIQLGLDIEGQGLNDRAGSDVSINGSGDRIAVGAKFNDGSAADAGNTRVYEWDGSNWIQIGLDIQGEAANDEFGSSISLSKAGDRIAIGARLNDGNGAQAGHARVFEWSLGSWNQIGADLDGDAAGDLFGFDVKLNYGGDLVLIGATAHDGTNPNGGLARAYKWNGANWNQVGADIGGEFFDSLGTSVDINGTGDIFAVGSPGFDGAGIDYGRAQLLQYTVESCGDFVWAQNSQTYNASGTYYDTLISANGCDSLVSLNLIINNNSFTTIVDSACASYFWESTGLIYTSSGAYNDTLVAANGCDSILTLNLTIYPLPTATIDQGDTAQFCFSDSITLRVSGNADAYQWYNADSTTWNYWKGQGFSTTGTSGQELKFLGSVAYIVYNDPVNTGVTVQYDNGTYWDTLGSVGFNGGAADYPNIDFVGGVPYVAYKNVSASGRASVARFNGGIWTSVGPVTVTANAAEELDLIVINNEPYIAYRDGATFAMNVLKYNGTSWVSVGLPNFSPGAVSELCIAAYNNEPYVAFRDAANASRATVMRYDGNSWVNVGGAASPAGVRYLDLDFDQNGNPHLIYQDGANSDQASVSYYNGAIWQNLGPAGFSGNGVDFTNIEIDGNTPYVSYYDQFLSNTVVRRYNGSVWELVGTEGFSGVASDQSLALNFGFPFVGFRDNTSAGRTSVMAFINPVISNADSLIVDTAGTFAVLGISSNECLAWDTITVIQSNLASNIIIDNPISCNAADDRMKLPLNWDDTSRVNYEWIDFGFNVSSLVQDPLNPANLVLQSTKTVGASEFAGVVLANDSLAKRIPFSPGNTIIKALVYSPSVGITVRLKAESETDILISVETDAVTSVANAWDTLYFDFSNEAINTPPIDFNIVYDKLALFYDFGNIGVGDTYYLDDVIFDGASSTDGNDGQITANPSGGIAPYTYLWSNSATTATLSGLNEGTYIVTITDNNGCVDIDSVTLVQPTLLEVFGSTVSDVTCNGGNDGAASVSSIGGTGTINYLWSNSQTTPTITGLIAGIYNVTATDDNGCAEGASILISEPETERDTIIEVACGSYFWPVNSQLYSSSGFFSDTSANVNGCDSINTLDLTINPLPSVSINQGDTIYFCSSDSVLLTTTTNGSNFAWQNIDSVARWNYIGSAGFTPPFPGAAFDYQSLTIINNEPYYAFQDGSNGDRISVVKYDGNNWVYVGTPGFSAGALTSVDITSFNNIPYVAFGDLSNTNSISVMRFDGINWLNVGLPSFTATSSFIRELEFNNGQPYLLFRDGGVTGPSLMRFDGTNWVYVGARGFTGSFLFSQNMSLSFNDSNVPYVAYRDQFFGDRASVLKFDGVNWVNEGPQGFTIASIGGITTTLDLTFINNQPIFVFSDGNVSSQASVMQFDGSNWNYVGSPGFSNSVSSRNRIKIVDGEIYVAFVDGAAVKVFQYNGTTWNQIGTNLTSGGNNVNIEKGTNNSIYVSFGENSLSNRASVMSFQLPIISTNNSLTVSNEGSYSITVESASGCTFSDTILVIEADTLIASIILDSNVSCNGLADGGATAFAIGGRLPYTYLWSDSATTASLSGLAAGTYTLTVTDNIGCTDVASITITEPPVLAVTPLPPFNETCSGANDGQAGVGVLGGTPPYTYLWSNTATTQNISGLTAGTYTVTVTDFNLCQEIDSVIIIVDDLIPPTAIARNITIFLDTNGTYSLDSNEVDNGSTDNCLIGAFEIIGQRTFGCADIVGPTAVQMAVFDANGNSDTSASVNVTVVDNISPVFNAYADITEVNDTGRCDAVVTYPLPSFTDNCSAGTITQIAGLASGQTFPLGTTLNTFVVADAAANTDTVSFNVIVIDTEAPVFNAYADITEVNDTGRCDAVVTYPLPSFTDNCSAGTITQIAGLASGQTFPLGTTLNTFVVADTAANTDTVSFNVIVIDTEAPVFNAYANITEVNDTGRCDAVVTYPLPSFTDNCSAGTITQIAGLASGQTFPLGTTLNTFVVADTAANTDTVSFNVIVRDTEAPVFNAYADITEVNDTGRCDAVVTYPLPSFTDNCSAGTITQIAGLVSGLPYPLDTTVNTFVVTDTSGNTDTISFNVIVRDTEAPVFNAYADITEVNDTGRCDAVVTYPLPSFTDNCSAGTITQIAGLVSGLPYPLDTTVNTFVVTDTSGNTDTISFNVIVRDTEAPVFNAYADITEVNDTGRCDAVVTYPLPSFTDNCSAGTITQIAGLASGQTFPLGTTVNTFVVADTAANTDTVSFNVIVRDTEAPVFNAYANITEVNDTGRCDAVVTYPLPSFTDNCSAGTITQIAGLASGQTFPLGTTLNTFVVADTAANTDTVSFNVIVRDTEAPVFNAYADITEVNDTGRCDAVVTYPLPSFTDNCSAGTITQIAGLASGQTFPLGTTLNTFVVADTAANTDTVSFNVIVRDTELPVVITTDTIVYLDANGDAIIDTSFIDNGSNDNCGIAGRVLSKTVFDCSDVGRNTITLVVTDVNGNVDSSTAVVTIEDILRPIVLTQNITVQLDANGLGSITPGDIDNGSRDNCGVQSRTLSQENFDCDDIQLSPITVTLTITDVNGNVNSATALVTVVDPIIPTQADAGIDQVICSDNSVMAANLPSIGSGQWSVVNGSGTFNDITSPTSSVSNLSVGVNTFEWKITTSGCNESSDIVIIQRDEEPTPANAGDDQLICDFTTTNLNAVAPAVGLGQWSFGTNGSGNIVNPNSRNSSVNGLGIGRNQLVWTTTNGVCPSSADIAIISVSNTPIIDAGPDLSIFRVDGAQLNVVSTPSEGVSYQWSPAFDIVTSSAIQNPFARPEKTTEFVVTVTDSLGCFTSDSVIVTVEGVLIIPTAFTPNNDGFNDSWEVKNLDGYASYKVSVFNGFGVKLFSTSNYEPWDGKYNGEDLPVGSYYFVIELETFSGENSVETGIVTIVK